MYLYIADADTTEGPINIVNLRVHRNTMAAASTKGSMYFENFPVRNN